MPNIHGLVSHLHEERIRVCIRINRNRGDTHAARRLDNAAGNFAPIGDQDFFEHVRPGDPQAGTAHWAPLGLGSSLIVGGRARPYAKGRARREEVLRGHLFDDGRRIARHVKSASQACGAQRKTSCVKRCLFILDCHAFLHARREVVEALKHVTHQR